MGRAPRKSKTQAPRKDQTDQSHTSADGWAQYFDEKAGTLGAADMPSRSVDPSGDSSDGKANVNPRRAFNVQTLFRGIGVSSRPLPFKAPPGRVRSSGSKAPSALSAEKLPNDGEDSEAGRTPKDQEAHSSVVRGREEESVTPLLQAKNLNELQSSPNTTALNHISSAQNVNIGANFGNISQTAAMPPPLPSSDTEQSTPAPEDCLVSDDQLQPNPTLSSPAERPKDVIYSVGNWNSGVNYGVINQHSTTTEVTNVHQNIKYGDQFFTLNVSDVGERAWTRSEDEPEITPPNPLATCESTASEVLSGNQSSWCYAPTPAALAVVQRYADIGVEEKVGEEENRDGGSFGSLLELAVLLMLCLVELVVPQPVERDSGKPSDVGVEVDALPRCRPESEESSSGYDLVAHSDIY